MIIKEILRKVLSPKLFYSLVDIKNAIAPNEEYKNQQAINLKMIGFYQQFINKDDLVFDIGSNFGNRIKPFLSLGAKLIAIEPQKQCTDFLSSMYGNKITIVQKGVGKNDGVLDFYSSKNTALSTFSKDWIGKVKNTGRFKGFDWNEPIKIPITTLDGLIKVYGQPQFVKIDVEGMEYDVLSTLKNPINNISFEYAVPENEINLLKIIQLFNNLGNYMFNYSVEETMSLELDKWLNSNDFFDHLRTEKFKSTNAGDVYASLEKK